MRPPQLSFPFYAVKNVCVSLKESLAFRGLIGVPHLNNLESRSEYLRGALVVFPASARVPLRGWPTLARGLPSEDADFKMRHPSKTHARFLKKARHYPISPLFFMDNFGDTQEKGAAICYYRLF